MPIYDYSCECGKKKRDEFVHSWDTVIHCECGKVMTRDFCIRFREHVFPAEGIHLKHVEPNGRTFFSKKEMIRYAREKDLELGALL